MSAEADVRSFCLALPGVTERRSWQQPAWFARTLMARIWEPGVLTVKTAEREALAGTFFGRRTTTGRRCWSWCGWRTWSRPSWRNCCWSPTGWPDLLRPRYESAHPNTLPSSDAREAARKIA